ncbi:MAG: phosphotransferase [Actinomycetota bacterium]
MPDASGIAVESFVSAAAVAAPAFGVDLQHASLLSLSENVVLRLQTAAGEPLVMRFHRPGYNSLAEMESEVAYVASLGQTGVPVPNAIATIDGHHYVATPVEGIDHQVGVVSWVAGEPLGGPLTPGGPELVSHYRRIGEIAGRIRAHATTWDPPTGFTRRRWDAEGLVGESPLWGRFWEVDGLTSAHRSLFSSAREELLHRLGELSTGADAFGLIHADLHLGNVMADGDELTVIDFDDSGFGWFVHELAVSLHPVVDEPYFDAARDAIVAGYRVEHPLSDEDERLIGTFLAMRGLMIVGWLDARRDLPHYEHFGHLVAQTERVVERFLT